MASVVGSDRIDFIIAGVQKGGTTSLDGYLRQHPGIRMGKRRKETHFFDKKKPTGLSAIDYAIYHTQFDWSGDRAAVKIGEATPIYTWWNGSLERIRQYNPDIKLIVLLRDPVERAWSHYRMDIRLKRDDIGFYEAIVQEQERCRRSLPLQDRERSLVSRGFYAPQVRKLFSMFPRENLLFLRSENLSFSPGETLRNVCDFLDVSPHDFDVSERLNSAPVREEMPAEAKAFLIDAYKFDAPDTRRLLGWEQGDWCV